MIRHLGGLYGLLFFIEIATLLRFNDMALESLEMPIQRQFQ